MSKNFEKVKRLFNNGGWPKKWVWDAVGLWITAEEYEEITGEEWDANGRPE